MEALNKVLGGLVLIFILVISRAFAFTLVWNMFMPQFFGMVEMKTLIAIAFISLVTILVPIPNAKGNKEAEQGELLGAVIISILIPWFCYAIALLATTVFF